jgi:hypothetical protein
MPAASQAGESHQLSSAKIRSRKTYSLVVPLVVPVDGHRRDAGGYVAAGIGCRMDTLVIVLAIAFNLGLLAAALALAWWVFRMVFWGAILFIAMAGKAWRGEL